jgi:hypothetical protein
MHSACAFDAFQDYDPFHLLDQRGRLSPICNIGAGGVPLLTRIFNAAAGDQKQPGGLCDGFLIERGEEDACEFIFDLRLEIIRGVRLRIGEADEGLRARRVDCDSA